MNVSPYLLRPCRTMEQIRKERIAEGRHPETGAELPWDYWDEEPATDRLREFVGMYASTDETP